MIWKIIKTEGYGSLTKRAINKSLAISQVHAFSILRMNGDISKLLNIDTNYDVYAFDVFDTLIERRIQPELIKLLISQRISVQLIGYGIFISPKEVLRKRNEIESKLQHESLLRGRDAEYFLDDAIRMTVASITSNITFDYQNIIDYELFLEEESTDTVAELKLLLAKLESLNKRIICISDTDLSEGELSEILEYHGLAKYINKIYVSSEIGKNKRSGNLFRHILGTESHRLVHIGNDELADYYIPKKLGIDTFLFKNKNNRTEITPLSRANNIILYHLGYDILGPALTVSVHTLARRANEDGLTKLFFAARDGYALKKIYEILRIKLNEGKTWPESKYLCFSRLAVRLPFLSQIDSFSYEEIIRLYRLKSRLKAITLRGLLSSYGLTTDKFAKLAEQNEIDMDKPIIKPEKCKRLYDFFQNEAVRQNIKIEANISRDLFYKYLSDIGFMSNARIGIVDGSSEGLNSLLLKYTFSNEPNYPIDYGYFLIRSNAGSNLDLPRTQGILFDWKIDRPRGLSVFHSFGGAFIEVFTHPNHGVTIGYKQNTDKVRPIFRQEANKQNYQLTSKVLVGILDYSRDYSNIISSNYDIAKSLTHIKSRIEQWLAFPQKYDVLAITNLLFIDDWDKNKPYNSIYKITFKDIITIKGFLIKMIRSPWPGGTLKLSSIFCINWIYYRIINRSAIGHHLLRLFGARENRKGEPIIRTQ